MMGGRKEMKREVRSRLPRPELSQAKQSDMNLLDQTVTQIIERLVVLKLLRALRFPGRAITTRYCILACECDVQYIRRPMSVVVRHGVAEAESRQRNGCFTHQRRSIAAILVSPYAIELGIFQCARIVCGQSSVFL